MARLPRLTVVHHMHWVVWRGNNGQAVFLDTQDRLLFLELMTQSVRELGVDWHAYVLLDSEVWLLLTPRQDQALSTCMQAVGRRYVRRFNTRHGRSGTLWEGRFRCTVLDAAAHTLDAMSAFDWEPVRAGLVHAPEAYAWSSHLHYLGRRPEAALVAPAAYWSLGNTPFAREEAYGRWVQAGVPEGMRHRLLESALKGWPVGGEAFVAGLQEATSRRVVKAKVGRPVKSKHSNMSPIK
jgi:putative transposase